MAKVNVFILSIFVIASLSSLSHGLINNIPPFELGEVRVRGVLNCTAAADLSGPPISGQTVYLECAGSKTDLANATTDLKGVIDIVVKIVDTVLLNDSLCFVRVALLGANCSAIPPDAVLRASISFVDFIKTTTGSIAIYAIGTFLPTIL